MSTNSTDVSRIQKRYTLTLINPSSFYHSLIISLIIVSILVATTITFYLKSDDLVFKLIPVLVILLATQYIDSRFIKNKEYSKSLHMSLFGNSLWLLTILAGLLSVLVFSKEDASISYITLGMFLFASLRIGIFKTTLGASLKKSWLVSFIQPMAMFFALLPSDLWVSALTDPWPILFGSAFLIISTVWALLTDRAGRPGVDSTHKLVQAYLASSNDGGTEVERLIEQRSRSSIICTSQIRLRSEDNSKDFRLVLPDIHPGPYHPIGGSNIPYLIYKNLDSSAMVFHSVSDHSLNLPSKKQVDNYIKSLKESFVSNKGGMCTEPVVVQINKARCVGIVFEKTAILFLSMSPHGMEDLPSYIRSEIEQYARNRKFKDVLVVDSHNAMGEEISKIDSEDLLKSSKSCLDALMTKNTYSIEFGYANSKNMNLNFPDLGLGGLGILCLKVNNQNYFLGWADSNNMENGLREKIVDTFAKNGYSLLEICTSDTHYSSVKVRNKQGYYQFGKVTKPDTISDWYLKTAKMAETNLKPATFEILENNSNVKVMGPKIFEEYSVAVDRSMKITKGFLLGCLMLFLISMI